MQGAIQASCQLHTGYVEACSCWIPAGAAVAYLAPGEAGLPRWQAISSPCLFLRRALEADEAFLGDGGDQRPVLRIERAAREAAGALRRRTVLRVEKPAVQCMTAVEPHGV